MLSGTQRIRRNLIDTWIVDLWMHQLIAKQTSHILWRQDVKTIVPIVTMEAQEEAQEGEIDS